MKTIREILYEMEIERRFHAFVAPRRQAFGIAASAICAAVMLSAALVPAPQPQQPAPAVVAAGDEILPLAEALGVEIPSPR